MASSSSRRWRGSRDLDPELDWRRFETSLEPDRNDGLGAGWDHRHVEKHGRTQAGAERVLTESLRDRHHSDAGALIPPDTRVDALADGWWAEIEQGSHSPGTRRNTDLRIAFEAAGFK
jgi:hypothetical protein